MSYIVFGFNKDPHKIPPKVEAGLRKELELTTPISYQVEELNMSSTTLGKQIKTLGAYSLSKAVGDTTVKQLGGGIIGGAAGGVVEGLLERIGDTDLEKETPLGVIHFSLTLPRQAEIHISVTRLGLQDCVTKLLYTSKIGKAINGEIGFEKLTTSFMGDSEICTRLNACQDLVKQIDSFMRAEVQFYSRVKIEPLFKLAPMEDSSFLTISTVPKSRPYGLGGYTLDARRFFSIVTILETIL